MGMPVIASGLNVFFEAFHGGGILLPLARLRSGSTVVQVVVDVHRMRIRRNRALVHADEAAGSRIHNVVLEHIVRHVVLHLELARSRPSRIVVVEGIVDNRAMLSAAALGIIAPYRTT